MPSARLTCSQCLRPQATCLCDLVTPLKPEVDLVILQHPLEVRHPKGSARLLHLSCHASHLLTGEAFDPSLVLHPDKQNVLLYPPAETSTTIFPKQPRNDDIRLIVLDGTWRKTRKLLHCNPWLQSLPRLALADPPESRYHIRRAQDQHQLSTLEATCLALAQLEQRAQYYQPLLDAFDSFVQRYQHFVPDSHP